METLEKRYILSAQTCDEIAAEIMEFCARVKADRKEALRCRLSAEECLLHWLAQDGEGAAVTLRMGRRMLAPFIELTAEGAKSDPYRRMEDAEDFGAYCGSVLENLRLKPEYSYENGRNRILFRLKRRRPGKIAALVIVLLLGVAVGGLGLLLPDAFRETVWSGILGPIYDTFFNILGCIAGPMIFLSVAWGIYGIGDRTTLGRIGKKLILRYLLVVLSGVCLGALTFPLLVPGFSEGGSAGSQLSSISELILGIFPSTIIEPFATGNTLQIIYLGVVIGMALLFLGRRTEVIAVAIDQINSIVQFLMDFIARLVPYVVFLVVVDMIWSGTFHTIGPIWRLLALYVLLLIVSGLLFLTVTSLRRRIPIRLLLKRSVPTLLLALTTASSAATFGLSHDTCVKRYGVRESLASFGLPLGMVMHKPMLALYYLLVVFYFAGTLGVPASPIWLAVAVLTCAIMAIAVPPIPGGGAIAYSVLFSQMGIPAEEAMPLALAIDMLSDFACTGMEMFCLQLSLVNAAAELNMADLVVMRGESE